jgi:hypothetical protein
MRGQETQPTKGYQYRCFRKSALPMHHDCRRGMRQVRIDEGEASDDSMDPSSGGTSLTLDYSGPTDIERASSFPISIMQRDVSSTNVFLGLHCTLMS